jgi:D-alanyl-D-alanine dipeptidase
MDLIGIFEGSTPLAQAGALLRVIRRALRLAPLAFCLSGTPVTAQPIPPVSPPATSSESAAPRPPAFVDAGAVIPGLVVDMRYFGTRNFVGSRVDGYEAPVCVLSRPAAVALAAVQRDLAPRGLGLKVFDCYRPQRAVRHFVRWARDPDNSTKAEFYPHVAKGALFREGYIASRSGHSRGSTVDLTLVKLPSNEELDMGTPFDFLSPQAGLNGKVSAQARANRKLLADAMKKRGFIPYEKEWWHFTLRNEPFPNSYFDFPVR